MQRKLHLLTVVFFLTFLFSSSVNAQHCTGTGTASGSGVCTPTPGLTQLGFYPPDTALACSVMGQPVDQVINFHTPPTAQGYTLNWIKILHIDNSPCGLCWRSNDSQDKVNGNSTGCVRVTGVTYDAPGEYNIIVYADVNVTVGFIPLTLQNLNIDSVMGLHYYLRVKLPNGVCAPVDTLSPGLQAHTVGTAPVPTITGASTVCPGATTALGIGGGSYYAYQWSTGEITSTIQAGAGTYSVTAYANCSSATATKTITNTAVSVAVTANGPTTFCEGGSVTLNAGSGFSAYAWSGGGTGQTLNVTQSGNYVVTVTQSGCTVASSATVVTSNTNPTPALTPSGPTTFCNGGSVTLDAGAGFSSYLWGGGETTQSLTVNAAGTYTATVTQNGCTGTSNTVTVNVGNPTPTATANGPVSFCTGGSVTLDAGAGYSAYLWSNGAITQSTTVTTSGNYSVIATQGGCNGTSNIVTVTVSGSTLSPVVTASNGFDICAGSTTLDAGAGYSSYVWSDNSTGQTLSASTGGTYTVTVSQGACSGSATVAVNVGSFPVTVNFTPANAPSGCTGDVITLDAGAGHASYLWSTSTSGQTEDVSASGAVTVTVTDLNGCSGTAGTTVTINPLPTPAPTPAGNQTICGGESLTLDAGAGFASYAWSNGDNTQTSSVSSAGSYSVTVTQNGCSGNSTANPIVVAVTQAPAPTVTPGGTHNICTGQFITLDAGAGYSAYLWSNGATTQTVSVGATGTFNVTVTQNGCQGSSGNPPTVFANVTPDATITELGTANGFTLLEASPSNASYQWLYGADAGTPTMVLPNITSLDTVACGDVAQFITLVVSQNGCVDTSSAFNVVCLGVNNIATLATFSVQPNPTNDVLNVSYELNELTSVKISVIDLAGRTVIDLQNENQSKGAHQQNIRVSNLANGIYLLNFNTGKGQFNTKFVKQ